MDISQKDFFSPNLYKLSSTNDHTMGLKLIVGKIEARRIRKGKGALRKLKPYHYSSSSSPHLLLGTKDKLNRAHRVAR